MHNQTSPAQNPPTILEILKQAAEYAYSFKEHVLIELQPHGILIRVKQRIDDDQTICNQQLISWNSIEQSHGKMINLVVNKAVEAIRQHVVKFEGKPKK